MSLLKSYILFFFFTIILINDLFAKSFSFSYTGPTLVTVPFGQNSVNGIYYFEYQREGTIIRGRLNIFLDDELLSPWGLCEGNEVWEPSSFAINFTPGTHTVTFRLYDDLCTQAYLWQEEVFTVTCRFALRTENKDFSGGTVYVDNYTTPKTAPYDKYFSSGGSTFNIGAIDQPSGEYDRIWNTSGTNNSKWIRKLFPTGEKSNFHLIEIHHILCNLLIKTQDYLLD